MPAPAATLPFTLKIYTPPDPSPRVCFRHVPLPPCLPTPLLIPCRPCAYPGSLRQTCLSWPGTKISRCNTPSHPCLVLDMSRYLCRAQDTPQVPIHALPGKASPDCTCIWSGPLSTSRPPRAPRYLPAAPVEGEFCLQFLHSRRCHWLRDEVFSASRLGSHIPHRRCVILTAAGRSAETILIYS